MRGTVEYDYTIGGRGLLQVGHVLFTWSQRSRHSWWKKWLHGVTILFEGDLMSTGSMQITQSSHSPFIKISLDDIRAVTYVASVQVE